MISYQTIYKINKLLYFIIYFHLFKITLMSQTVKKIGNYKLIKKIGSGATSQVFEGRKQGELQRFAIKMIKIKSMNKQQKQMIAKQVIIIKSISHPNIVRLHQTLQTSNNYYLIFQYCQKGDLQKYLKQNIQILLKPDYVKKIVTCIAEAINHLHERGIVHRDIKLANILLKKDFTIKLADFGFAREFNNEQLMMQTYCGTPITMAPQILLNKPYDKKCDIWSMGVILFQLIFGKLPFPIDKGYTVFIQKVTQQKVNIPQKPKIEESLKDLIYSCLQINKSKRHSIEQFLASDWIRNKKMQEKFEQQRQQKISEVLKRVSKDKIKIQIMDAEISEHDLQQGTKEESQSFEKSLSKRIYTILYAQLMKIIKRHLHLRKQILKLIEDNKELQNLLIYYDYQIIRNLQIKKIKLRSEGYKDLQIFLFKLSNLNLPEPYGNATQTYQAGTVLMNYLKKLAAQPNIQLQKKKTRYQIILLFLDLMQNFDLEVNILFNHGYEYEFSMQKVIEELYLQKQQNMNQAEDNFLNILNHITIVLECRQKEQKFRQCTNLLKMNCQKRIDAIQRQINGY